MRIYSAESQEALRARSHLKDWAGEAYLAPEQYQRLEQETLCDLRRTNIFLRLVLAFFTLLIVGAATGLLFFVFLSNSSDHTTGIFLLILAPFLYAAAELAASRARLYRYGIEEALAACSVGFLCFGWDSAIGQSFLVSALGALLSLWIWHRFGLSYFFLAAMLFVPFLAGSLASSHSAQHLILVGVYVVGLTCVAAVRSRHRLDYLNDGYSLVEAFLWLGIYLAINLRLSPVGLAAEVWGGHWTDGDVSGTFYWTTYVLIWCVPALILARGVREKDRFVIAAGVIAATLTLLTNKSYLGWPRHTWDPMLLGLLFFGIAIFLRRWLASGPGGVRNGFTSERLSGKDKKWIGATSAALSFVTPPIMPSPPQNPDVRFGGGDSGGGGASSDF